ncbi:MAG TPA: adenosylcobinamide-GDP ribazoletransferase [Puia sp.]|nr:adenosylcobinamide-GDP ribazoletransferase [Puia sp.]
MIREWRTFLTAVMFLTRIRVPDHISHSDEYLQKAPKYFPVIGWMVGGISALVFLVFDRLVSTDVGLLASVIAGILVTGAFHEDGFADSCDAFGGGWTKEKILAIMKDSRLGTYGVIGLMGILSAKFLLLKELPHFTPDLAHPSSNIFFNDRFFILTLIAAHSMSRLMPLFLMRFSTYVTDMDTSKSKPIAHTKLSEGELLLATAFALLPFVLLSWHFLLALIPVLYATYELSAYFKKWIGGYTGDCLGAVQQVSEVMFYFGTLLVWKFF